MNRTVCAGRRRRRRVVGWVSVKLAVLTIVIAASAPHAAAAVPFKVLQLNLCNSAKADCHAGAGSSVNAAIAAINVRRPDVVTLNDVCARDITTMSKETSYRWAFEPTRRSDSNTPLQCSSGRGDFGVAVLTHPDLGAVGNGVIKQVYRVQDGKNEQRVILCAPYSRFTACTTHLSPDNAAVALRQCQELAGVVTRFGRPTVVGGDFNLTDDTHPNIRNCVPRGWIRAGDGDAQHVMATDTEFDLKRSEKLSIAGTARPGLLVELSW